MGVPPGLNRSVDFPVLRARATYRPVRMECSDRGGLPGPARWRRQRAERSTRRSRRVGHDDPLREASWPRHAAPGHRGNGQEWWATFCREGAGVLRQARCQFPRPKSASDPPLMRSLMQIARASCSPLRAMRVLHPADPPSWRNQDTSHDLPKLGVAGSIPVRRVRHMNAGGDGVLALLRTRNAAGATRTSECRISHAWDPCFSRAFPPGPITRDVVFLPYVTASCPASLARLGQA